MLHRDSSRSVLGCRVCRPMCFTVAHAMAGTGPSCRAASAPALYSVSSMHVMRRSDAPKEPFTPSFARKAGPPPPLPPHPRRRPKRHVCTQPLSVELGSCSGPAHAHFLEDSWRGEILDGFLFLGDRVTASDSDRLGALGITYEARRQRGMQRASAGRLQPRGGQHITKRDPVVRASCGTSPRGGPRLTARPARQCPSAIY